MAKKRGVKKAGFSVFQCGASMVEFIIIAPVLLILGLGTIQIGLIYHAKLTLNYATFEAAREGAVNHAQSDPMALELAYRLAPVFGGDGSISSLNSALASSFGDLANPLGVDVEILNPTSTVFDAWEVFDHSDQVYQIPNHHLRHQSEEIRGGVSIHDANLLKIRSRFGYQLKVPLANKVITQALLLFDSANGSFYQDSRIPLSAVATVRMQNEARRNTSATSTLTQNSTPPVSTSTGGTQGGAEGFPPDSHGSSPTNTSTMTTTTAHECDEYGLGPIVAVDQVNDEEVANLANLANEGEGSAETGFCAVGSAAFASSAAGTGNAPSHSGLWGGNQGSGFLVSPCS